jgi:hypothetical protein
MQVLAPVTHAFGAGEFILTLAVEISRIVFDFALCADVNTVLHSAPSIRAPQWGQNALSPINVFGARQIEQL